ncbi:MAG TPA: metallophosphoesterase [bacterium]|uniref:Calcineurin-like phosphoesterase n=1 Tax=candidate division TA06 bacterium ADurb.Bin417 TaxID=1852828 RepID=A0A1V5MJG6_UNCT6|nr:MAG: Calcineurin-like phosphoesterase [candidate division TA06 bacterium ADurb.Bin417]HNQ34536.1 metallophosphoesterase [bacterium]HNS48692.1 metallophosphoesterase [bacterium]
MPKKKRFWQLAGLLILLLAAAVGPAFAQAGNVLWQEDFEGYADNSALNGQNGWTMLKTADTPAGVVKAAAGTGNSKGLALSNSKGFRSDYIGLTRNFAEPLTGTLWIQCRFRMPAAENWTAGFNLKTNLAQVSAGLVQEKDKPARLRFVFPYYEGNRIWREIPFEAGRWYTVTLKLDTAGRTYSGWVDGIELGGYIEMAGSELKSVYLGAGGQEGAPAVVDDLVVTRNRPAGINEKPAYPAREAGHLFRFAAIGDPQPGKWRINNYQHDLYKLGRVAAQVNESGADFSIVTGDLVHDAVSDTPFLDALEKLKVLKRPWYPVRGEQELVDLYRKHIRPELNYSFEHQGFRFVMLDAVGGETPLAAGQLDWVEKEFQAAAAKKQEIILCSHVSPWDENRLATAPADRLAPESKARLVELLKRYRVLMTLAGHYHRGLWHFQADGVNYLVLPVTSMARVSPAAWTVFDVYPDRVVVTVKPLFFAAEDAETKEFYDFPYQTWRSYQALRAGAEPKSHYPYQVGGPLVIKRTR